MIAHHPAYERRVTLLDRTMQLNDVFARRATVLDPPEPVAGQTRSAHASWSKDTAPHHRARSSLTSPARRARNGFPPVATVLRDLIGR